MNLNQEVLVKTENQAVWMSLSRFLRGERNSGGLDITGNKVYTINELSGEELKEAYKQAEDEAKKTAKEIRRERYLKLKKEFENE